MTRHEAVHKVSGAICGLEGLRPMDPAPLAKARGIVFALEALGLIEFTAEPVTEDQVFRALQIVALRAPQNEAGIRDMCRDMRNTLRAAGYGLMRMTYK